MTAVSTASAKTSAPRSPQSSPVVGTDEQCVGARRQAGEVNGEKSVVGKHVHRDERGRLLYVYLLSQDPVSGQSGDERGLLHPVPEPLQQSTADHNA